MAPLPSAKCPFCRQRMAVHILAAHFKNGECINMEPIDDYRELRKFNKKTGKIDILGHVERSVGVRSAKQSKNRR